MPMQIGLAALLMSGAMHSGEPAKLALSADAISQPNGGAPLVLARNTTTDQAMQKKGKKGGKKNPGSSKPL